MEGCRAVQTHGSIAKGTTQAETAKLAPDQSPVRLFGYQSAMRPGTRMRPRWESPMAAGRQAHAATDEAARALKAKVTVAKRCRVGQCRSGPQPSAPPLTRSLRPTSSTRFTHAATARLTLGRRRPRPERHVSIGPSISPRLPASRWRSGAPRSPPTVALRGPARHTPLRRTRDVRSR